MAKKSARAKGYRTYKKEVKGFTETEKKIMIIGFTVLVLIIIAVIAIPNMIENRHLLKVRNGVVQDVGDNWLISNMNTSSAPKYRKIAEVNPAEGFEPSETVEGLSDKQERILYFAPTGESVAQTYYTIVGKGEYDVLSADTVNQMAAFNTETLYSGEIVTEEFDGKKVAYYVMEYTMDTAMEEDIETLEYNQVVNMYVDTNIDDRCILVSVTNNGEDDSVFVDREALIEVAREAARAIVLHED